MSTNGLVAEQGIKPFRGTITKSREKINCVQKVICAGPRSQLVSITVPPEQDLGEETHDNNDQILFIIAGKGEAVLDGEVKFVGPRDAVFVAAGTLCNLKNIGRRPLRLFSVRSPCRAAFIY